MVRLFFWGTKKSWVNYSVWMTIISDLFIVPQKNSWQQFGKKYLQFFSKKTMRPRWKNFDQTMEKSVPKVEVGLSIIRFLGNIRMYLPLPTNKENYLFFSFATRSWSYQSISINKVIPPNNTKWSYVILL